MQGTKIINEEIRLSRFTGEIIVYLENLEKSTIKLLALIRNFSTLAGYKANIFFKQ